MNKKNKNNSKIVGYFEQSSLNSNMHSSNYEISQPEIFTDPDQNNDLKIRRVETSDNLEVSDEHQQRQFVDFS